MRLSRREILVLSLIATALGSGAYAWLNFLSPSNFTIQVQDSITHLPIHATVVLNDGSYHVTDSRGFVQFDLGSFKSQFTTLFWVNAFGYPSYNSTIQANIPVKIIMAPSPTQGLTCEPGGCNGPGGTCSDQIWNDGTTPVDTTVRASQIVGTAGQDPAAFVNSNLLTSGSGKKICFSSQTFTFQVPMRIAINNLVIQGQGWGTVFKASASFARGGDSVSGLIENSVQATTGVQNITIRDLAIDGNKGARSYIVDDGGIRFDGASGSLNKNIHIDNIYVHDVFGSCINGRYVDQWTVTNFVVENCSDGDHGGIYHGVYYLRSSNGNVANGVARGIKDGSGIKIGVGDFNLGYSNIQSLLNKKDGFEFSGGSGVDIVRDITMSNTVAANNTLNGYDLNVGAGDNRFTFSAISSIFNVQNGFVTNNLSNMTLTGCNIMNNAFGATGWQGLRISNTKDFTVTGCRIGDSQSPKSQQYGIYLVSGDSYLTFTGNDLTGNLNGAYSDAGSSTHILATSNQGYNPQARSAVTAGASVWTYTNNDPYPETMILSTVNGLSSWTCANVTMQTTTGDSCPLYPYGESMTVTWATTAPVFTKVPQ